MQMSPFGNTLGSARQNGLFFDNSGNLMGIPTSQGNFNVPQGNPNQAVSTGNYFFPGGPPSGSANFSGGSNPFPQYVAPQADPQPAALPARSTAFMNIPQLNMPTAADMQNYYNEAFKSLQPYYDQKLKEAQGDLEEAKKRIEYDYSTGARYNTEDTQLNTQRQNEDLQSSLEKLGMTFKNEKDTVEDTLNKRGIALTQDATGKAVAASSAPVGYDASGNPTYAGNQGQAGSELSMLSEDQRLRKEAETRATQRNIQDIGIKSTRTQAQLTDTQQRSTYDTQRQYQQTGEQIGEQQQSQAYNIADQKQKADIQKQQMDQQNAILKAQQQQAGQI